MSFQPLSRPTTPANSVKGLAPFRTPRSRPGQQSSHSIFGSSVSHESRPVSRVSSRQHRRTSSTPEQPFAAPKSHVPLQIDRHQREPTSRASSPPVSGSHFSRQGHSIRSSLQSLARSGSFSLPKTPKGRRSTETPELIEDEDDHSDGSRFDLLSSDPFRSETPIAILDIEEPPPLPPKPLHIIPPAEVDVADEHLESPTPISDGSRTPTGATVAAMKSAFNRLTLSGKPRLRLLSFIKETRSPAADHEPSESPPKLQLPTFAGEPLFDVSGFQLPDLPAKKKSIHVEGRSLGHAAPPSLRMQPSGPAATSPIAGNLAGASALQLNLNGNEFEGYILETPLEADTTLGVPEPEPEPQPEPEPEPVVRRPMTPKEPPGWIVKFREELEVLAGEALSLTSLGDKLVLELPEEPGRNHRRTLVFQETDLDESTPELTSDSISISSHGRPPRPTRPPPPIPRDTPEEGSGAYIAELADNTWNPDANREACASLLSIHSSSTWDPSQPIPSIPDQDSSYFSSDDDQTIRAAEAPTQPHVFEPSVSKAELIEEAIRKIQRKAEASRLRVIEEDESEVESDASEEPIVVERGPTLTRHISNPFATNPAEEQKPPRKVSLLRKRVLSKSLGSPKSVASSSSSSSASAHSRSASVPTTSEILREKNVVIAGRLPLTSRSTERELPSLPPPVAPKPPPPQLVYDDFYQTTPHSAPLYLTKSTPTFEVVPPHHRHRSFQPPAVYYPTGPTPFAYHQDSSQGSGFFGGL